MSPSGYTHGDTPQKAMVRGALSYLRGTGLVVNKTAVFRHFGLSRAQGYSAITAHTSRADEPDWIESRGRPSKISKQALRFLEYLLWNDIGSATLDEATAVAVLEGRAWSEESQDSGIATTAEDGVGEEESSSSSMAAAPPAVTTVAAAVAAAATATAATKVEGPTWESLMRQGRAFGLQTTFNARTMRRAMGTLLYRRCLCCQGTWVNPQHRTSRVKYARSRRKALPDVDDWRRVRFSGELHFAFGLDGRMRLLPRPGEKYACPACQKAAEAQEQQQQQQQQQPQLSGWDRDIRRVHAWAAIGYGYRSDLVFYDEQTGPKSLGIMTPAAYRSAVLEREVQEWPVGGGLVWEEEHNPHAAGGNAIDKAAEAWKDARRLRRHRGCPDAPDLCPLDFTFGPRKQWRLQLPDWEPETLQRAARQVWAAVDQAQVDAWVERMPQRLDEVIKEGGSMVMW
ncbi:HMG box protein [Cordyceps fumosorosea ARSEF 2679]|uniref:HMG box protein n=1 Tax=Cordyceps fumosorosea (strain ARSEF 2679) TaxID=1081104 RepID=A0A167TR82_CORFA|nr:HMG box protein [Cordyceps fumosorosea ARSEF 2679]OAA60862.1 HMG box protein [Cordyceps fumosorosea ARSEF 2679]